ncbi:putative amidohydrolase YtcJ [Nakamurella sp. UYEF19]|uniref:amidohydrolase family protein n=1 Tax=Nakamurella sp. UYEF19 TaxID=1756392 RepID=UPI003395F845
MTDAPADLILVGGTVTTGAGPAQPLRVAIRDGGTAWLSNLDSLGESVGPGWDLAAFDERLRHFGMAGIPVAVHSIGDAATRHVLDALAALPAGRSRYRLEPLETVPDDLVARFAPQGVAASMQPSHATGYTDADGSDNWSRRLGFERVSEGWRCADLARAGAVLVLGSDWPVADFRSTGDAGGRRLTISGGRVRFRSAGRAGQGQGCWSP